PPAAEVEHDPRDQEAVVAAAVVRQHLLDLLAQAGRDTLVRVDVQHPAVLRAVERVLLLIDVPGPRAARDVARVLLNDVPGAVGRVRVDDHDLVAPRDAVEAVADPVRLVAADDDAGDRQPVLGLDAGASPTARDAAVLAPARDVDRRRHARETLL